MTKRDIVGRYRGSAGGLFWALLYPLLTLLVYTFVFGVALPVRWNTPGSETIPGLAITLFSGLIIFNFFSECLNRAPHIITQHSNYVKKTVFPLEILPLSVVASALFHTALSASVLIGALAVTGRLTPSLLYWPLLVLPVCIFTLGITWAISALTVFVKDIAHAVSLITTLLLFLSPIFYPMSSLPAHIQPWVTLNPLAFIIEESRAVVLGGRPPNWQSLLVYYAISLAVAVLGLWIFRRLRGGFADII